MGDSSLNLHSPRASDSGAGSGPGLTQPWHQHLLPQASTDSTVHQRTALRSFVMRCSLIARPGCIHWSNTTEPRTTCSNSVTASSIRPVLLHSVAEAEASRRLRPPGPATPDRADHRRRRPRSRRGRRPPRAEGERLPSRLCEGGEHALQGIGSRQSASAPTGCGHREM